MNAIEASGDVVPPRARRAPSAGSVMVGAAIVLWTVIVVVAMGLMLLYEKRPGRAAQAPANWPVQSRIERSPGVPTLVMILHPRCPCSSASVEELAHVLAHAEPRPHAVALIVRPAGTMPGWERTPLWNRVAAIPGVAVQTDSGGVEAARFGSWTSGQILLYDAAGRLRFSGGITGSRGMAGDNAGADALLAQIASDAGRAPLAGSSVYGCELHGRAREPAPGGSR